MKTKPNRRAFTIVELVIVIAVIAILATVLIPTFSSIIEKANQSNALQEATNQLKADALNYTAVNGGTVPDDTVYEVNGYYFKVSDNALVSITEEEYNLLCVTDFTRYKNIILLIADGGGYDNLTITDKVKTALTTDDDYASYNNKIAGAMTTVTTDTISGETHTGSYLLDYLVGSANTMLPTTAEHGTVEYSDGKTNHKYYITDSSAAGTALASGYKTIYCYSGVDEDENPGASITELAKMAGKSVGVVSTKSYADATPLAFLSAHSIYRYEYADNAIQAALADVDVAIFEGTYYGDLYGTTNASDSAHTLDILTSQGYQVIGTSGEITSIGVAADYSLLEPIINGTSNVTKLWAPMLGVTNSGSHNPATYDTAADLIGYDVYGEDSNSIVANQPSLLEMSQAALKVLENGNNEEGFFLMIEGGAIDNAAEGVNFREFVGDYLSFDETFAYCVEWAKTHGDNTLVIACPDHDSGGFYGVESFEDALIDAIITGTVKAADGSHSNQTTTKTPGFSGWKTLLTNAGYDTSAFNYHSSHTDMCVPISMYCPASYRSEILTALGLPTSGDESTIRQGTSMYYVANSNVGSYDIPNTDSAGVPQYRSSALNSDYIIENTDIAPIIAKYAGLGNLRTATSELYVAVGHYDGTTVTDNIFGNLTFTVDTDSYKTNAWNSYYAIDFTLGSISGSRNSITYNSGIKYTKIGNMQTRAIFVLDSKTYGASNKQLTAKTGTLFLPQSVLVDNGLAYAVKFTNPAGEALESLTIPVNQTTFTLPTNALSNHWNTTGAEIKSFTINGTTYEPGATVNVADVFTDDAKTITVSFTMK